MKHVLTSLLLFAGLACALTAQTPTVKESQPTDINKKSVDPRRIVYSDANGYLLLGYMSGDLTVQRINNDLTTTTPEVIDNRNAAGDVLRISGSQVINNQLCLFWIHEDGKANKFTLYSQLVDPVTAKPATEKQVLLVSNTYSDAALPIKQIESDYYNYFRSAVSPDHRKLVLVFPDTKDPKAKQQSYSIHVFDSLLHPLKEFTQSFAIEHGQYLLKDIQAGNNGDVVFTGIETVDGGSMRMYEPVFPYIRPVGMFHLTYADYEAGTTFDRTINLKNKLVTDVAFLMGEKSIQVMGFWSDRVEYSNRIKMDLDRWYCKGSFFQEYDYAGKEPNTSNESTFTQELINDCDNWMAPKKSDVDRRKTEAFCLTAQEILHLPNGDYVLVSEQLSEYTETSVYAGTFVFPRYTAAGEHKNTADIARMEVLMSLSTDLYTRGYIATTMGNDVQVIYEKGTQGSFYNMFQKHNEASFQRDIPETSIVRATVDEGGQVKKTVLKDIPGEGSFRLLQSCSHVNTKTGAVILAMTDYKEVWFMEVGRGR